MKYYSVGSGKGQTAFLKNDPSQFNSGTITVTGTVDFANSDAPLSSAQVSAYSSTGGLGVTNGPLIQIPYIVTPITIPSCTRRRVRARRCRVARRRPSC
ncbi:substrate-binding domain-containing protein [Burkholderia sp. Ac-20353]|uniref:substrate-binding domain-containing protein n=1 Tax=Burkholderia sp. Ac-20353 TaxID=2703894 RepID=UPI003217BC5B